MKHTFKLLALLIVIGLSGCATNSDLEAVKALAQQANATAEAALNIAQDAKATSDTTENKIERIAKKQKPMRK